MKHTGNLLCYGDCLNILQNTDTDGDKYIKDESVDLIYLDPPFNSNKIYNIIFHEPSGHGAASQIKGFEDTWAWNDDVAEELSEIIARGDKLSDTMIGLEKILEYSNMFAYLVMMATRLSEMKRVLKDTGTLYLHCDQTAGHYIKIVLDAIFGPNNFRNEIVWCYTGPSACRHDFPRKHDVIFRYSKTSDYKFYDDKVRVAYSKSFLDRRKYTEGSGGIMKGKGPHNVDSEYGTGKLPEDWWANIPSGGQMSSKERIGYPTQKPEALLERILLASSEPGDTVLDPFCGCGTTVSVAQRLGRRWIGIDITAIAMTVIKNRLKESYPGIVYDTVGEPESVDDAKVLAKDDEYQFQLWALGLDNARPSGKLKKGSDKGIDGKRNFVIPGKTETIIYSVKSGHVSSRDVRDIARVIDREKAAIGVLISLNPIKKTMYSEAATMGFYEPTGVLDPERYPRLQLYTVEELMSPGGKRVFYPRFVSPPPPPAPIPTKTKDATLDEVM